MRTPSALAIVTRLLPTLTFSSIPWFLIQVSPLEILTMLMPLTFLIKMVRSFSTCISLPPNSSREISLPFSSLTQTSPRIVIEGEEGEEDFDLFFGGEEEEAEGETGGRFLRWVAGEPALGEGGAKMEEKGSLFSPGGAEVEEEEEEAATTPEVDDDFLDDFVTSSSPSSSLPLDKLANFSFTSLILGSEENLGMPGTPRFGDFPRDRRSSSSPASPAPFPFAIFCIIRFSIFFSIDSSMSTSSISLASSSASRMRRSDSARAFRRFSASAS